ncbi:hypothetical protein V7I38_11515 [Acinetobacter baumannii]|uniref:Uncharacterized protein n=5 Tax=Acinetobacter baumannii TaxID=470 RepID=A0AAP1FBD8_ACIBA|nr:MULTISPECIES: hypothetical protein [Gammaproteobacteria]ADX05407.1 Hypothetical protein ABK1_3773 [Acinetobacter baumannii 1656-2]AII26475.1 hypothetical protein M3Q_pABCC72 [Acinetobacter baumannii TYTH-1]AKQ32658.1 hypothetical protein ACX61_19865 [Acinetobacter baumannii]AMC17789.1 hypothetical protein AXA63_19975 [Acinetobacter baumannii]AOX71680.1 hypothetical protein KAB01_03841 [Acinetobacter baumannii]
MKKNLLNMPLDLQMKRANEAGLTLDQWQQSINEKLANMHQCVIKSMVPTGKFCFIKLSDSERFQRKMDSAIFVIK